MEKFRKLAIHNLQLKIKQSARQGDFRRAQQLMKRLAQINQYEIFKD